MINRKDKFDSPTLEADSIAAPSEIIEKTSHFQQTFASLYHRNYLYFWIGAWLSNIGTWLQTIALGWLVLEMTDSSFYLGLINFASMAPVFILSFTAGIYADRLNKKMLIIYTQSISLVLALILGFIIDRNIHNLPSVFILAFLSGISFAMVFPAWQAFISELVPRKDLLNAIALNSAQFHAARLIGPMVAGLIISALSIAACFYINGLSFLFVIIALFFVRINFQKREIKRSGWQEFSEGLSYALKNKQILYLLVGVGFLSIFGLSTFTTLMPVFARDILHGGPKTLGYLMGANGFGALLGALTVAYLSNIVNHSIIIKYGMLVFSISIIGFAFSSSFFMSVIVLAIAGFAFLSVMSTMNTSLQSIVPQQIRGRIMSFFVWMFIGQMPVGSIISGSLAHVIGAPLAVGVLALFILSLSFYLLFFFPILKPVED